jgi:hypothetical protein
MNFYTLSTTLQDTTEEQGQKNVLSHSNDVALNYFKHADTIGPDLLSPHCDLLAYGTKQSHGWATALVPAMRLLGAINQTTGDR